MIRIQLLANYILHYMATSETCSGTRSPSRLIVKSAKTVMFSTYIYFLHLTENTANYYLHD